MRKVRHFALAPRSKGYPDIIANGGSITAKQETRWLGTLLDRKLSFLSHNKWVAKAAVIVAYFSRLYDI